MWRKIKNGLEYCGIYLFIFAWNYFKIKLLFDTELAMVLCYMTQNSFALSFWNGTQNVVLNPLQFPIKYSSPTWFPYLWHAMWVYVPHDKANQKKKSFVLCLVWELRHRNMHKVILFVVKKNLIKFQIFILDETWMMLDELHPYWKCMCWWKMKY